MGHGCSRPAAPDPCSRYRLFLVVVVIIIIIIIKHPHIFSSAPHNRANLFLPLDIPVRLTTACPRLSGGPTCLTLLVQHMCSLNVANNLSNSISRIRQVAPLKTNEAASDKQRQTGSATQA